MPKRWERGDLIAAAVAVCSVLAGTGTILYRVGRAESRIETQLESQSADLALIKAYLWGAPPGPTRHTASNEP